MIQRKLAASIKTVDKVKKAYREELSKLRPTAKLQLDGLSLVCKYSKNSPNILIAGDETGKVYLVDTNKYISYGKKHQVILPEMQPTNLFVCHGSPIFDLDWNSGSNEFLTASGDLTCGVWDVETSKLLARGIGHTVSIRCVKSCQYNPKLFVTGGRDGKLMLWDIRTSKKISEDQDSCMDSCEIISYEQAEENSFTGLAFLGDEKTLVSTQINENDIRVWDLRKIDPAANKSQSIETGKKKRVSRKKESKEESMLLMKFNQYTSVDHRINKLLAQVTDSKENLDAETTKKFYSELEELLRNEEEAIAKVRNYKSNVKGNTSMYVTPDESKILVANLDHKGYMYKVGNVDRQKPKMFEGFEATKYAKLILSPTHNFALGGSRNHKLYIWDVDSPGTEPFMELEYHVGEVNGVDWSSSTQNFIASVADDHQLVIWSFAEN